MSQDPAVEEVMRRIRARVNARARDVWSTSAAPSTAPQGPRTESVSADTDSVALEIERNDLGPLQKEIATALEGTHNVGQINPRNPGLHNDAIQVAKKVMRRSLTWYTRPLHYFQGGVVRALQRIESLLTDHEQSFQMVAEEIDLQRSVLEQTAATLSAQDEKLARELQVFQNKSSDLHNRIADLTDLATGLGCRLNETNAGLDRRLSETNAELDRRLSETNAELKIELARSQSIQEERLEQVRASYGRQISAVSGDVAKLRSGIDQLSESFRHTRLQGRLRDRDIRRFLEDVRNGVVVLPLQETTAPVPAMFPSGISHEYDFDYFAFEDLYRGEETLIRKRHEIYLQYFCGRDNVLDVGCGRGEFLELLKENNISAKGVELGTDQYLVCKEKGLEVVQQDLFSYLESLPDESLGGLFSAQVIEHLTASDQLRYVALAHRKTKPGSPVIFETINAQCVWAVVRNFFLDPTHVRPIHPETLKFAMESANFNNVALRFSSPMSDRHIPPLELEGDARNLQEFNRQLQNLNDLLYGNQDYAAIGWR